MKKVYLVSISGGKDSQTAWIYMLKHYSKKGLVIPYFADTGWEADETYEHIRYLEKVLGKVAVVSSDKYKDFEDMCIKRKGFPTRLGRFCTQELKLVPSEKFIRRFKRRGYKVINVTGVRKDESPNIKLDKPKEVNGINWWITPRREAEYKYKTSFMGDMPAPRKRKDGTWSFPKKGKYFYSKQNSITVMQPIIDRTAIEVLNYNLQNDTKNNPLYAKGRSRVGCYPCIMANKFEIGSLEEDRAVRIMQLEKKVQAVAINTKPVFFHRGGS